MGGKRHHSLIIYLMSHQEARRLSGPEGSAFNPWHLSDRMSEEGGGQEESVELSLRLDQDGRTTYDPSAVVEAPSSASSSHQHSSIDYSSKTLLTKLAGVTGTKASDLLDDLLFDAEIADCALLPRTFWMPAEGMKPRCRLEQMAMEVFHKHVPAEGYTYDKRTSGAEWWVQIRPSPTAGRYSMLADVSPSTTSGENDNSSNGEDYDMSKSGISFHWDKDEDLRLAMGGNLYIHPHLSTVTYLTDLGAPTAALNYRVDPTTGAYIEPNSQDENSSAYISWPKQGKHLSFDGRLLHAAPGDLLKSGEFAQQCKCDLTDISDEKEKHAVQRRHRRVTFLVNIWLNFKPINVNLFPEGMIDKLSSSSKDDEQSFLFESNADDSKEKDKADHRCDSKSITVPSKGLECDVFSWPMGGCGSNERMNVAVPLTAIQEEKDKSGNVCIEWMNENGVAIGSEREGDTERVVEEEPEAKKQKIGNAEKD